MVQLAEGQEIANQFTLLNRLKRREHVEVWLALDTELNERVALRIFKNKLSDDVRQSVRTALESTRGLVHPSIARLYAIYESDENDVVSGQFVRGASQLNLRADSLRTEWHNISHVIDALSFAHGLGLAHGHLHPGNLLVDEQGLVHITDFGLPASTQDDEDFREYLSPQIKRGADGDSSDDIFSLGQILATSLTGNPWRTGNQIASTSPLPTEVTELISAMLRETAYERPTDLREVQETIQNFVEGDGSVSLESLGTFNRAQVQSEAPTPARAESQGHRAPRERYAVPANFVYGGLGILALVALIVFFALPVSEPSIPRQETKAPVSGIEAEAPQAAPEAEQPDTTLTPYEIAKRTQMEADSTALGSEILRLQVKLEDLGVVLWARADFDAAVQRTEEADTAYRSDDFEAALEIYQEVRQRLENILETAPSVFDENLATGEDALLAAEPDEAIKAFSISLAIENDNEYVKTQLDRAENLEQVISHVSEAEFLESEGKLVAAQTEIGKAVSLDSKWQLAHEASRRINGKIAQRNFNDAMSDGLSALGNAQYDKAREAFNKAQRILPNSSEPADGLAQIDVAIRTNAIDERLTQAESAVTAENWEGAIAGYEAALALDSTLVKATVGLKEAEERLALDERLAALVADPTVLADDAALEKAKQDLVAAARAKPQGARLKRQTSQLAHHIALARIPIEVTVHSDNRTDVTVYKVGNLGRLDSTSLDLIPGSYKIVGKRSGYRDVEFDLTLIGGREQPPVVISCTEKI